MVKWLKMGRKRRKNDSVKREGKKTWYQGMYSTPSAMLSVEYILNRQVWALFIVEAIEFEEVQLWKNRNMLLR